jgi:hypothetical protein
MYEHVPRTPEKCVTCRQIVRKAIARKRIIAGSGSQTAIDFIVGLAGTFVSKGTVLK